MALCVTTNRTVGVDAMWRRAEVFTCFQKTVMTDCGSG
jgi:hypothetical protein